MASGLPFFGGANGVTNLDLGQVGGSRQLAGTALLTVQVSGPIFEMATVRHGLAEQNVNVQDQLGLRGTRYTWTGILRASTEGIMDAMLAEIGEKISGSKRSGATGELAAPKPKEMKSTLLTDSAGNTLSNRAKLAGFRPTGRKRRTPEWATTMAFAMEFVALA